MILYVQEGLRMLLLRTTAPRPQIGSKYQQLSSMADSTNRNSYSEREKRLSQTWIPIIVTRLEDYANVSNLNIWPRIARESLEPWP